MVFSKARVEARRAFRKLAHAEKLLYKKTNLIGENLAKRGKYMAREIAPYYSGKTAKFIRVIQTKGTETDTWMIQAMNPTKSDHKRKKPFNLVEWMHRTDGGDGHIKSGEPRFMNITSDYLNRIKGEVAKGTFKNIRIK